MVDEYTIISTILYTQVFNFLIIVLGQYMGGYNKTTWAFIGKLAPASASQGHQGK